MHNLLQDKKWRGDFFLPGKSNEKWSGEISYSPSTGIVLNHAVVKFCNEKPFIPESTGDRSNFIIHGFLENGEKCTLIDLQYSQMRSQLFYSESIFSSYQSHFRFLLTGHHIAIDDRVNEASFLIFNSQEFFHWVKNKDYTSIEYDPIVKIDVDYGKVSIIQSNKLSHLPKDISSRIFSRDPQHLEEIKRLLRETIEKHSMSLYIKDDIEYFFNIEYKKNVKIASAYENILSICGLFALLNYQPTFTESISLRFDGINASVNFYPALYLKKEIIEISSGEKTHFHLPINQKNVDLKVLLSNWATSSDKYRITESIIQRDDKILD